MIACSECCVEMRCSKNSIVLLWGESHARAGDEFTCPECGNTTVVANVHSYEASALEVEHAKVSGRLREMK